MRRSATAAAVLLALGAACGKDSPTASTRTLPSLFGVYHASWAVHFRRHHDGFSGSFTCWGSLSLGQNQRVLSGFMLVSDGCPAASFPLSGLVWPDGSVSLTTGSPRPNVGQCPSAENVVYSGSGFRGASGATVSARGTAQVFCPGPGEGSHSFAYVLTATGR
jgi:hypothetical protein